MRIERVGLGLAAAAVALATHPGSAAAPDGAVGPALARINAARSAVGLPALELDPRLSRGCELHARYLHVNRRHAAANGMGMHTEVDGLPGASDEGRAAAAVSIITRRDSAGEAVEAFLATFYHRIPLLRPGLKRIGIGISGRSVVVNAFDGVDAEETDAVPYPAPQAKAVPLEFPLELPDPIPAGAPRPAGFPITLQFPQEGPEVRSARAELRDEAGRLLKAHLSSPERPATQFSQMNTVCLIPASPLRPGGRYRVSVSGVLGEAPVRKEWSFATRATEAPALLLRRP